jgi:hypothetical protein
LPKITLDQLTPELERQAKKFRKRMDRALYRAAQRGRRLLMQRSPVGVGATFRSAWSEPRELPDGKLGYEVVNDSPHAAIVEYGSRPHMPPVDAIALWVQRKFQMSEAQARKVAWAVAMSIKKNGTKPHHVAGGAEAELKQIVHEEVMRELRRGGDGE